MNEGWYEDVVAEAQRVCLEARRLRAESRQAREARKVDHLHNAFARSDLDQLLIEQIGRRRRREAR